MCRYALSAVYKNESSHCTIDLLVKQFLLWGFVVCKMRKSCGKGCMLQEMWDKTEYVTVVGEEAKQWAQRQYLKRSKSLLLFYTTTDCCHWAIRSDSIRLWLKWAFGFSQLTFQGDWFLTGRPYLSFKLIVVMWHCVWLAAICRHCELVVAMAG